MNVLESLEIKAAMRQLAAQSNDVKFDVTDAHIEKSVMYCRRSLNGKTGIQDLLKPQDTEKDGVRNIDSAKLSAGTAFICTSVVISVANSRAGVLKVEDQLSTLDYSPESGASAGQFFNNELSIKIGSKEKLKAVLRHMLPVEAGDNAFENSGFSVSPFVIPSQAQILPQLNIFNLPCPDTEDIAIEVAFVGYKISQNN